VYIQTVGIDGDCQNIQLKVHSKE